MADADEARPDETNPLLDTASVAEGDQNSTPQQNGYHTFPQRPAEAAPEGNEPQHSLRTVLGIVSVMMIGVFISQMDGTLVMASIGSITAEFDDLQNSGWLFSSFALAMCVAQPLYGKLSDVFGRKAMLQVAYFLFALGSAASGLGRSMVEVILGRAVQGLGGAGMVSLVSILLTDLVPLREVAVYRSYVNIVQTVGRSCGGPIGGLLAQTIGWRWSFFIQAPLTVVAMILVAWKLELKPKKTPPGTEIDNEAPQSLTSKIKRIDFPGAVFMSTGILSAVLILDMGGEKLAWTSPTIAILAIISLGSGIAFFVTEKYYAKEPIFPLSLIFHKEVALDYLFLATQVASQLALMLYIPLYFQVTKSAGPAEAALYLVPAVIGNTTGGLTVGVYVKRTGRYKLLMVIGGLSTLLCFTLLLLTWHGNTPAWQSLFVFFGGYATGIAQASTFVDLAATVGEANMAIASSGLYLSANIGSVFGVSAATAVFGTSLRFKLGEVLADVPNGKEIAEKALSNIEYVQHLQGKIHGLVISAYVFAFHNGHTFSLICGAIVLILGLLVRERRLH